MIHTDTQIQNSVMQKFNSERDGFKAVPELGLLWVLFFYGFFDKKWDIFHFFKKFLAFLLVFMVFNRFFASLRKSWE